ncbi:L-seryl-tRNA(Sec) kinase-like [Tetranychus urticae]|uniref:Phosphoseryl-tRNA kinase n=1 Tax=Tetranychus urticae TaxID=32264 RepID=T1K645_TETUR|nr:L-seryl-tRNA(Sec) kinase-like [Tetranychus urticae]
MNRCCIVLISGLPASGKTVFTTELVNYMQLNKIDIDPFYINFDKVIPLEDQKLLVHREDSSWRQCRKDFVSSCHNFLELMLKSQSCSKEQSEPSTQGKYLNSILDQLSLDKCSIQNYCLNNSRFCLIVEDNFYYKSMREEFFRLAKQFNIGFALISFNIAIDICIQRNTQRPNSVNDEIIQRMAQLYEKPKADEFGISYENKVQLMEINFDNINHYDDQFIKALQIINKAIDNPIESHPDESCNKLYRDISRKITASNSSHRFDNVLRQCASKIMTNNLIKVNGKELSLIRKELLKKFGNNQLDLPVDISEETSEEVLMQLCLDLIERELEKKAN